MEREQKEEEGESSKRAIYIGTYGMINVSDFVYGFKPPLSMCKPSHLALVAMDLSIFEHARMHYVDILDGLTKYFLENVDV
ncbi:unnamed protein product [Rotaria magnacalcarata]|uniref:Uncharacterized protein n=1 Tax=Rotaria magnacalcarata TaxID=392030 RepID=A0A819H4B0_9BILA|nr:unnamed protein product [Rotaria magnacalcarata]CAF3833425.1 unnamed protein product [Rotaria magnacalcarata]CAF3894815.1 unnamed protein product [Rotaria magnacalcarata]CAF4586434.1 unnamed protein product [Rotaria magnacalcarata]CAF5064111.1 unnamed protein product [Rotaria magnacalcarata]